MVGTVSQLRIVAIWYALLGTFCFVGGLLVLYVFWGQPFLWNETGTPFWTFVCAAIAFWLSAGLSFRYLVLSGAGQTAALVISVLLALGCIVHAGWVTLMIPIGPRVLVWWALAGAFSVCARLLWRHRRASNSRWTGREIWVGFTIPVVAFLISLAGAVIATRLYDASAGPRFAAQPHEQCSLTSTVTDAKLTLSIQEGRTSFREGEIIPLVLSFTSTADKRYRAVVRNYDRSGRLHLDSYCLEPEVRDPLADYFATTFSMGGGLGGEQQLSEKPFTATAELNEWRQPGPGHYRLYVVSPRVSVKPTSLDTRRAGAGGLTLRSNTIEFDVIKTDAESRAKQLQEATAAYQSASTDPCHDPHECVATQAARRLRFLNTKESTETLARLFWGLNEQPGGWDLMFGLFGSAYPAEAITAMQREIRSPDHPITQDFLRVFTKLQLLQSAGSLPREPSMDDPAALRNFYGTLENMEAHEPEVRKAALTATVAALSHKTGRAHR